MIHTSSINYRIIQLQYFSVDNTLQSNATVDKPQPLYNTVHNDLSIFLDSSEPEVLPHYILGHSDYKLDAA